MKFFDVTFERTNDKRAKNYKVHIEYTGNKETKELLLKVIEETPFQLIWQYSNNHLYSFLARIIFDKKDLFYINVKEESHIKRSNMSNAKFYSVSSLLNQTTTASFKSQKEQILFAREADTILFL